MNRNLGVIFKYSFLPKVKTKAFLVLSGLILLIGALITVSPLIVDAMMDGVIITSDIGVISKTDNDVNKISEISKSLGNSNKIEKVNDTKKIEEYEFIIDLNKDTIYKKDDKYEETEYFNAVLSQYNMINNAESIGITQEELGKILATNQVKYETVDTGVEESKSTFDNGALYGLNYVIVILSFMLFVFGIQFLGQEILEEKSTKSMEVIITNIEARSHMFAKIASNALYLIIILLEIVVSVSMGIFLSGVIFKNSYFKYSMVFDLVFKGLEISNLIKYLLIMIPLLLITILIFLVIMAIMASGVTTTEDYQTATLPVTFLLLAGYMVGLIITSISILKILTYIPIINYFVLPNLYLQGELSIIEIIIPMLISAVTLFILVHFGKKVYREGVLNYSSKKFTDLVKQAFKK